MMQFEIGHRLYNTNMIVYFQFGVPFNPLTPYWIILSCCFTIAVNIINNTLLYFDVLVAFNISTIPKLMTVRVYDFIHKTMNLLRILLFLWQILLKFIIFCIDNEQDYVNSSVTLRTINMVLASFTSASGSLP